MEGRRALKQKDSFPPTNPTAYDFCLHSVFFLLSSVKINTQLLQTPGHFFFPLDLIFFVSIFLCVLVHTHKHTHIPTRQAD